MTDVIFEDDRAEIQAGAQQTPAQDLIKTPGKRERRLLDPDTFRDVRDTDDALLFHAYFDNPSDYEAGHIPGAQPLDTLLLESPETWNRRSPAEIEDALTDLGIRSDTTVLLYGRYSDPTYEQERPGRSAGQIAAMRCALILTYAGVEDVRVLDGGVHAWRRAGYDLTDEPTEPDPVDEFGVDVPANPEHIIDLDEADELRRSDDGVLVDFRSREEHIGEWSGYHYIEDTGRIAGSEYGRAGSDAYHVETLRDPDGTTRPLEEIARTWVEAGITPDKHVSFYCGTGWRASEAWFAGFLMGWPRVSVYDGGWYEWIRADDAPIAQGPP